MVSKHIVRDRILRENLDQIKDIVNKDWDFAYIVDGEEGVGKSTFAQQVCKYLDPTFNLDRVVFSAREFIESADKVKEQGKAIMWDEAIEGGASSESLTKLSVILKKYFMKMRYKRMFVVLVIPTFFELNKYLAIHRTRGLFHCYAKSFNDRGKWGYYHKHQKQLLYLLGKKTYDYNKVRYNMYGEFNDRWWIDYKPYLAKKDAAMNTPVSFEVKESRWKKQRDAMILNRYSVGDITQEQLAKIMGMTHQNVAKIINSLSNSLSHPAINIIEHQNPDAT